MSTKEREIYNRLSDRAAIERLVAEKVSEDLYLEFKQKSDVTTPDLSESDKRNFSEAISEFANSDGGVLIFGVKTEKPGDYAIELKPIKNPEEFLKRLFDALISAVQPSVDGIEGKVIKHDDESGYILFSIPSSFKAPHRAMVVSREYFKRN